MLWRNQPGGYLKEILTARVYDVAVRSPAILQVSALCILWYLKASLTLVWSDMLPLLMQVESQLELAKGLSQSLNNRLFLKREDLQPVCSLALQLLMSAAMCGAPYRKRVASLVMFNQIQAQATAHVRSARLILKLM